MLLFRSKILLLASLLLFEETHAEITVSITESGEDVVANFSGTANTTDLSFFGNFAISAALDSDVYIDFTSGGVTGYSGISGATSIGPDVNSRTLASSASGDVFGFRMVSGQIRMPIGYVSGTPISGTTTWANEDFASLGITAGTYTWTWGSGANADSLTIEATESVWYPPLTSNTVNLESTLSIANVWNVHYSRFDDLIYYSTRNSSSGAVYRLEADGSSTQIYSGSAPGGLYVAPDDGAIFISFDFPGVVLRVENDLSQTRTWVSGFGSGDDDTAGVLIVPDYYSGSVAAPGDGFVTDRGFNGTEAIYSFSKDTAEGEVSLISFNREDGLYGIFATDRQIIATEYRNGLLELTESEGVYSLTPIVTSPAVPLATAAAWDDLRKVLYLVLTNFDESKSVIAQYDPATGEVVTIIEGLSQLRWNSLSVSSDYTRLYAADFGAGELLSYAFPILDGDVTIGNPSFEAQPLADGNFVASIDGWETTGGSQQGVLNPTVLQYSEGAPDGANVAYSNSGTIAQTLNQSFQPDTRYTLSVFVGGRADSAFDDTTVSLYAGGQEIASTIVDAGIINLGSFEEISVSFESEAGNPFIGEAIEIRLQSTGIQSNFDDVRLVATPLSNLRPGREPFYESSFEPFFDQVQSYDGSERRFGGPVTVPTGSGESVAIDFSVSPYPELVQTPGGTQLNLGRGSEIDPSIPQIEFTFLARDRPVYNLTFYYEGLDTFESFEFPGQFPDRFPGLAQSGNQLTTLTDGTNGSFTFLEVSADALLTILFNRSASDIVITGVGFELVKPAYDGSPYAYSANTGWINFDASTRSQAVRVGLSYLHGYAYDANTGWIFFGDGSPLNGLAYTNENDDHGVNIGSGGNLEGYAWSANTGWISFDWAEASDPNRPQINQTTGSVSGYAWSANLGWILLDGLELPSYIVPNSTDPSLIDFGANFSENTFTPFFAYDDGDRDFTGTVDTDVGQSDPLGIALNIGGSFEVVDTSEGKVIDIGLGTAGETTVTFRSDDAKLYNLSFSFEGFDIGEQFNFGAFQPDLYTGLQLSAGELSTRFDAVASSFTFSEFPANTELTFTITHDGSGVRMTGVTFDASETTIGNTAFAYSANTGWIHLSPNSNTGVVVHETYLSGYAHDANTGWIKLGQRQPDNGHTYTNVGDDHGVNRDGNGALYGYGWSGNIGWIYFGWAAWNDPNAPWIDLLSGDFAGYAWAGNIGWINLGTGQLRTDELRVDDIDLDGMADAWEKQTFDDLTTAGINTDQDGDAISDAAEYVGGTNPLDRTRFLRIVSTAYNGDFTEVTVEFTSDAGRIYTIQQAEDLASTDPWSDSGLGTIAGDAGITIKTFTYPGNDRKFFRVQAALPLSN